MSGLQNLYHSLEKAKNDVDSITREIAVLEYKTFQITQYTVHDLNILPRYIKVLAYADYLYLDELDNVSDSVLLRIPNFGLKALKEVRQGIKLMKNRVNENDK